LPQSAYTLTFFTVSDRLCPKKAIEFSAFSHFAHKADDFSSRYSQVYPFDIQRGFWFFCWLDDEFLAVRACSKVIRWRLNMAEKCFLYNPSGSGSDGS